MIRPYIIIAFLMFSTNLYGAENNASKKIQTASYSSNTNNRQIINAHKIIKPVGSKEASATMPSLVAKNAEENARPHEEGWLFKLKTDPVATFTALLFVATLALYMATRKLVTGAEITAARDLRAYVFVDVNLYYFQEDKNHVTFYVHITLINYGKTPAIIRGSTAKIIKDGHLRDIEGIENITRRGFGIPRGIIVSHGEPVTRDFEIADASLISGEDFININNDKMKFMFGGKIVYEDVMKQSHETAYCVEYNPITKALYASNDSNNYYT
jgi:hypothetical protein